MLGLDRPIRDRHDLAGHLANCGRAVGWDVVVDVMLWRTAVKSGRYACELADPEPIDAVRRHLPF